MTRTSFFCIDAHTCGNPVRLVAGGGPYLIGDNMSEKRLHFLKQFDWIRKSLMFEPRGHDMMSGSILYPPSDPDNDVGVLFIETSGCLPMCGHGTIGTVTIAIEEGLVTPREVGIIRIETPAGLVIASYQQNGTKVESVRLTNIGCYLAAKEIPVNCPELGDLQVDVAFGGNFYAIVDPQSNFLGIEHYSAGDLIRWSPVIRKNLCESYNFIHPIDQNIKGLSHVMWTGKPLSKEAHARNAVFYGDKAIDRSPCGTGTSARMAQWVGYGRLKKGDSFIHESIIGSKFIGRVEDMIQIGGFQGIIPSIEGWARITGYNHIIVDDDDPYVHGFQVI